MEEAESSERAGEIMEHGHRRLNRVVAVTVVVAAVFMTFGKVKSEKITERMQVAQAQALDQWNFYQAKSVKQHLEVLQVENWQLQRDIGDLCAPAGARVERSLSRWQTDIRRYDKEKAEIQQKAEAASRLREQLEQRNDRLHLTEALIALAIALLAVAGLVGNWALYGAGVLVALLGIGAGAAAMLG